MREKSKNLILIDGHALAYRSFFALERTGMKTSDGQPTWAVYGFFKAFFDILKKHHPDAIAVSFDCSRHTFRTDVFKDYKANRESMPDTMRSQMEFLFEGLEALDIPIYKKENFEADDVIGTIATKAKEAGHHAFILTGDRDSFQLVDKEGFIKILIPSSFNGLEEYDTEKVFTKMEVYPEQIVDYKALSGDSSDNIPGVKGIGHKTAVKLLGEYKTLENIYQNIDKITQKAVKQKLIDGEEIAKMSKFLATIDKNVDIDFDFEKACLTMPKAEKVADFFKKLQFYSFLRQIDSLLLPFGETQTPCEEQQLQENAQEITPQKSQLSLFGAATTVQEPEREIKPLQSNQNKFKKIISTKQDFDNFFEEFKDINLFSLDTETTGLDTLSANLVGIAIAYDKNFVWQPEGVWPGLPADTCLCAGASVVRVASSKNGARLRVELEIELTGALLQAHAARALCGVELGEEYADGKDGPALYVYYARQGERVFDIAKRYHARARDLVQANRLEAEGKQPQDLTTESACLLIPAAL